MDNITIDLNCDLGEGLNNEAQLMPYLSSCNIACGGHAGDKSTMQQVVRLAKQHNLKIGAHPSFPDKINFGRKIVQMTPNNLKSTLIEQIENLLKITSSESVRLSHIKPHGALYNLAAKESKAANVIAEVLKHFDMNLKLYAPYDSVMAEVAEQQKIEIVYEAFADRNYNSDLSLVSRSNPEALITDSNLVFEHVKRIINTGKVKAINGVEVRLKVDTFCVHGDQQNALEVLRNLSTNLKAIGVSIA